MRRASLAVVVVLPEPCRPTIMIATGGTALRSMVWPSDPRVEISSSWTIFTTIWPGVTDLTTVAPTACSRTFSVKLRTTSSATSASSSARRTSRIAASTSASDSEPRPVSRSRMPLSRSDRLSNNAVFLCLSQAFASLIAGHTRHRAGTVPTRWRVTTAYCVSADNAETDISNTFAPEGASRCRTLTSGLQDRAAVEKKSLFEERRRLNARWRQKSRRVVRGEARYVRYCRPLKLLQRPAFFASIGHDRHPPPTRGFARRIGRCHRCAVTLAIAREDLFRSGVRSLRRATILRC